MGVGLHITPRIEFLLKPLDSKYWCILVFYPYCTSLNKSRSDSNIPYTTNVIQKGGCRILIFIRARPPVTTIFHSDFCYNVHYR